MGALDSIDYVNFGTFRLTESNLDATGFVMNLDGGLILHGDVSQDTLTFDELNVQSDHQGFGWQQSYTLSGSWVHNDTFDIRLHMATQVPYLEGEPDPTLLFRAQTYSFLGKMLDQ
jgi:hypothetical protein